MQKWEYMYLWVEQEKVTHVNGQVVESGDEEVEKRGVGEWGARVKGKDLYAFLHQAGEDGWELVTHSMKEAGGEAFVFKRPKPPLPLNQ